MYTDVYNGWLMVWCNLDLIGLVLGCFFRIFLFMSRHSVKYEDFILFDFFEVIRTTAPYVL